MRGLVAVLVVLAIATCGAFALGWMWKSELDGVRMELAACRQEAEGFQKQSEDWKGRFETEKARCEATQDQILTVLPDTLQQIRLEQAEIIALVPQEVRGEVSRRLDTYLSDVAGEFQKMSRRTETLIDQLEATRRQLDRLADRQEKAMAQPPPPEPDTSREDELEERERAMLARHSALLAELEDLEDQIRTFDQTKVNCRNCDDVLKMPSRSQTIVLSFHARLLQQLRALRVQENGP